MTWTILAEEGLVIGMRGRPLSKRIRGYVMAVVKRDTTYVPVHRLIWESVHGAIPPGLEINHINGLKHDNRIANLELVTPSENTRHAYRIGLRTATGEQNGRAQLSEEQVRMIRSSPLTNRELSEQLPVSSQQIRRIRARTSWSHVSETTGEQS
jgi:hypothetical protein